MSELEHTPLLPWHTGGIFNPDSSNPTVNIWSEPLAGDQSGVVIVEHLSLPLAALICRAVNAHAGLAKALTEAERFMAYFANETDGHFSGDGTPTTCLAEIRAALAAAGVKP